MHLRGSCALALALVASCSDDAGREIAGSFQPTLDGFESGEDTGDGEDDGELFDLGTPDPSGGGGSPT